ncbi:ATP synthase subunit alpha [Diplogelasinospora grovesii]|uniref:ATP synthase subunit alpha n=1 Tax=Diplogelasinospora grovesii TaxID=303347 RepID=A0AAN6S0J1_9PEZI|nr:ATP synthase subunit alpha [Diplogelasinospora grovesii]
MTASDMMYETFSCPHATDSSPPAETCPDAEPDDDFLVLTPDQASQRDRLRETLRLCEPGDKRYALCVQKRDELLDQDTGLKILIATCEHVMATECPEYRQRKQTKDRDSNQPSPISKEDDVARWDRFLGLATDGSRIKSTYLSALKEVWVSKGEKYWNQLRTTARKVHLWDAAVVGLNCLILERYGDIQRRPVKVSVNPIEQADLERLRIWSLEDSFPCQKLAPEDLPSAFGFDKFGLIVYKEYAAVLPEPDSTGTSELLGSANSADGTESARPNDTTSHTTLGVDTNDIAAEATGTLLAQPVEDTAHTGRDRHDTGSAEDTAATPLGALPVPHSLDSANATLDENIGMTLRARPQRSYQESGAGTSKPKRARLASDKTPKTSPRCCPAKVPSTLLFALGNPSLFGPETAKQFSPFLEHLCRTHLQLFATRTSAIASAQSDISSPVSIDADRPVRRRAASLPDITEYPSKRLRLDGPPPFPSTYITRSDITNPMQDRMADDTYRRQVQAELLETSRQDMAFRDSHGKETDKLVRKLLEKVEQPNTDSSQGVVDAFFCTGDEAASLVEAGSSGDAPIITEGQQQFRWSNRDRPIAQLFRRMGGLDKSVSVQIPSRKPTTKSFAVRKLSVVRERFLNQEATRDPWNILDLQSPLPQSILPNFLTGEDCQLLLLVRNTVLMENSAERVVASTQEWNEWKNVLEWVLMSEGGHNTAPHMDSHGFGTWLTVQEGRIGFGWMSCPTSEEREAWMADPRRYTGGRWRYTVLKPGKSVFFPPGTIHFVFRVRSRQTLALGGHVLQWSGIQRWMQVLLAQMRNPAITNENMKSTAPKHVRVVANLVSAKVEEGGVEELGGEAAVADFFASVKKADFSPVRCQLKLETRGRSGECTNNSH